MRVSSPVRSGDVSVRWPSTRASYGACRSEAMIVDVFLLDSEAPAVDFTRTTNDSSAWRAHHAGAQRSVVMNQPEMNSSSEFARPEIESPPGASPLDGARMPSVPTREVSTFECVTQAERKIFVSQRDLLPPDLGAFLTPWSLEQYDAAGVKLYLHRSLHAGYGLLNGELISVFSLPGAGLGREVVLDAVERGATHLDCLTAHEKLKRFYESCGFTEVGRVLWDDAYAPGGWNYERFGKPDLIFMRVEGR